MADCGAIKRDLRVGRGSRRCDEVRTSRGERRVAIINTGYCLDFFIDIDLVEFGLVADDSGMAASENSFFDSTFISPLPRDRPNISNRVDFSPHLLSQ